jgi:hypothetical protein
MAQVNEPLLINYFKYKRLTILQYTYKREFAIH